MNIFNKKKFPQTEEETEQKKPEGKKSGYKLYMRVVAFILVVAMIVSSLVYNNTDHIGEMASASFNEEGEAVKISPDSIKQNLEAIQKAKVIRKELSEDYEKVTELIQDGKYEEAMEPAEELYKYLEDDENVGPYLRSILSEIYFITGNYDKCEDICEDIIKREEIKDGSIEFMDGVSAMQTQNYDNAIKRLEEAIDAGYSQEAMCKSQLALAHLNKGNYEKAASYADEVLGGEHDESLEQVLTYISSVSHLQLGDYEEGIEGLTTLLDEGPNKEYYYYRGVGYMALEDYKDAQADFEAAMENGYDETGCYYNLGLCAYMNDDTKTAKSAFQTVVDRNDDPDYLKTAQGVLDALK